MNHRVYFVSPVSKQELEILSLNPHEPSRINRWAIWLKMGDKFTTMAQTCFEMVLGLLRHWNWTQDLASISTMFGSTKLKLMTISLSHLKATQHLNWGNYFSFGLGLTSEDCAEGLIPELSLKDSWKTEPKMFPILVLVPAIMCTT